MTEMFYWDGKQQHKNRNKNFLTQAGGSDITHSDGPDKYLFVLVGCARMLSRPIGWRFGVAFLCSSISVVLFDTQGQSL